MKVTWVEPAILLGYILDEVLNFEEHTAFLKDDLFIESRIVPCNSFQSLIVDGKKDFLQNTLLQFGIGS